MFLKKTALIFVSAIIIPSIFNFALADRMAGSNFNKGIISQIGQCKDLAKHHAMAIEISVNNQYVVYVISGNITPYTLLKDQDGSTVDCNALQKGMTVTVGHMATMWDEHIRVPCANILQQDIKQKLLEGTPWEEI